MIIPLKKHILVEPIHIDDFVAGREQLMPIGVVLAMAEGVTEVAIGDEVYFEKFLAKKFPGQLPDTEAWFVSVEDVCGKRYGEISK